MDVILSLVSFKCFPILLYGLESVTLQKQQKLNLAYVYNAVFAKLFSTFDKGVIAHCQYYTGYLPFLLKLDLRKLNFLCALSCNASSTAGNLFQWLGQDEFKNLALKYNYNVNISRKKLTHTAWTLFKRQLLITWLKHNINIIFVWFWLIIVEICLVSLSSPF